MIFLGLKFWPNGISFGSMKDAGIFLGNKEIRGIVLGCQKRTK